MSLLAPLTTFKTGDYTVTRRAAGTRADGEWSDGATTTYANTPMQVTPVSGKALATIPVGRSADDVRSIRCAFDLRLEDCVTIDGDEFEVYLRRRWNVRGQSYTYANVVAIALGP